MEGYNSKQKLYIFIAIAIFITINLLALVFALPFLNKGSVKGIYTDSLNSSVLVSGNLEKPVILEPNKEITDNSDSLYIKNPNYTLFALPESSLNIQDSNTIKLNSGIYYFETNTDLTIKKGFSIQISPNSKVIFDFEEDNIYVLKGEVKILTKEFKAGFVVNLNSETLAGNLLDKAQLLSTNKAKEINKLLVGKSLFVPELNFLSTPQLEMKDNLTEIQSTTPAYTIEGTVSPLSHVFIDTEEVIVNSDGTFSLPVNLISGINYFRINIVDEVANTLSTNIKIVFTN